MERIAELLKYATESTCDREATEPGKLEKYKAECFNRSDGHLDGEDGYKCDKCRNKGTLARAYEDENGFWRLAFRDCECMEMRKTINRMKQSGLKDIIRDYTFAKYQANEDWQKQIKESAMAYAKEPSGWFFIGGQSGCVDCDTEYFTGVCWKKISEYDGGYVLQYNPDLKTAEMTKPKRYISAPAKKLYQISTMRRSIDQVLSADHNFAYVTSKGHMAKKPFHEVMQLHRENTQGFYGRVETAFEYDGGGIDLSDGEIRLMCAVIADGTFSNANRLCRVNVKKERKKERMRELLAGCKFKEYKKSNGYSCFSFYSPRREKIFSEYWYGCSNRQLRIIADEVFYWDGSVCSGNRRAFFSTEKASADFVQFALSATGTRATICVDSHRGKKCYTVLASSGKSTVSMVSSGGRTKAKITEYKPKDGKQYCFEVETGYLVLRRNGRIFVTGNSGKTHICTAICRELLLRGMPVQYMLWRDDVVKLKASVKDAEAYGAAVDRYKTVKVLYIDDLFKTGKSQDGAAQRPTGADVNLAFEILNFRYGNPELLTIISSECTVDELLDIDEAVAGRIVEKAKTFSLDKDRKKNWRLKGAVSL